MLTISNKGQTEALAHYTSFEEFEEVNGGLTLSLTSFPVEGNAGHSLLEEEAIIASDGRNFRIKQLGGSRTRKQVKAISTFFDLGGHRKYETFAGTKTFNQFADWLFAGTGWTYENVDVIGSKLIPNYGNENFLKLLEVLISTFECERRIMPGNHVVFQKQIGPDNDEQYRYGHNIKALSHSVDATNLRTSIKGYGGNGLEVTYTSPNASKFPHAGDAEPFTDDRFTVADSLLERIKQELNDTPEVAIEMAALELTEKELGERVWLIYEPLGIEFQTRILAKYTRKPASRSSAVIGNAMPKSLTDQLTEQNVKIDENQKQTQSKFEQTNEQITLAVERIDGDIVEAYSQINITADAIRSEVGTLQTDLEGKITANTSVINQTASSIRSEVSTEITRLDGRVDTAESSITQTAASIRSEISSEVEGLDGRIDSANSSITQLAGSISLKADSTTVNSLGSRVNSVEWDLNAVEGSISQKVSYTDYTGTTIASKINQSASSISISAAAIDLNGIVRVNDSLELGYTGNGKIKAIKFNGSNAWIYSAGDFRLTLDASTVDVVGDLRASSKSFGTYMPVITGTSSAQAVSLGLSPNGELTVYRPDGSGVGFTPNRTL